MMDLKTVLGVTAALILAGCSKPTQEETQFQKKFDQDAVLVKTCGVDPGIASGIPMKVYRYEGDLWFSDRGKWRKVDAKPETVCDLLDVDAAHRHSSNEITPLPRVAGTLGFVMSLLRHLMSNSDSNVNSASTDQEQSAKVIQ